MPLSVLPVIRHLSAIGLHMHDLLAFLSKYSVPQISPGTGGLPPLCYASRRVSDRPASRPLYIPLSPLLIPEAVSEDRGSQMLPLRLRSPGIHNPVSRNILAHSSPVQGITHLAGIPGPAAEHGNLPVCGGFSIWNRAADNSRAFIEIVTHFILSLKFSAQTILYRQSFI